MILRLTQGDPDTTRMKRTPKEILEWLCTDLPQYWRKNDEGKLSVNIYRLAKDLKERAIKEGKDEFPSQSTLARGYDEETDTFKEPTLDALSEHFGVPKAIIRGDVDLNSLEAWGMDINISELRLLKAVRDLTPEQREAVYKLLHTMLPGQPALVPPIAPPKLAYFPGTGTKRSR